MKKYYLILLVLLSACSADPVEPEVPVVEVTDEPEVVVPDYDNDPIYSKGRPNVLSSIGIFSRNLQLSMTLIFHI